MSAITVPKLMTCSTNSLNICTTSELITINDMYDSCKLTIISTIILLNTDPSFDGHVTSNNHLKRSLLPFLGNALRWLTGTATTTDVNSIKECVNQLIVAQST